MALPHLDSHKLAGIRSQKREKKGEMRDDPPTQRYSNRESLEPIASCRTYKTKEHTWNSSFRCPAGARMANLLLIDNDPDLLPEEVAHLFPAPANRVEIVHTGADGLKRAADTRPDVIL